MCTVSFYKDTEKVVITHNRDEHISRPLALDPQKILMGNKIVYCPIDPKSNGTWFALENIGNVFVLLNGAEKKHTSSPPYKKSRGLILLDIVASENFLKTWKEIDLYNIEPFTIIAFVNYKLFQLRWNENEKLLVRLETEKAHIWSSTTLYSDEIIKKREIWFSEFLIQKQQIFSSNDFINFHNSKNDLQNGLIINRNQQILTKNITQCEIKKNEFTLTHFDLIRDKKTVINDFIL